MRITVTTYKNSKLASFISVVAQLIICPIGCFSILFLLGEIIDGRILEYDSMNYISAIVRISMLIVGFKLFAYAKKISERAFIKESIDKYMNRTDISSSVHNAINLYSKVPDDLTLKIIEKENPEAAEYIYGMFDILLKM